MSTWVRRVNHEARARDPIIHPQTQWMNGLNTHANFVARRVVPEETGCAHLRWAIQVLAIAEGQIHLLNLAT